MPRTTAISEKDERPSPVATFAEHSLVKLRSGVGLADGRSVPRGAVGAVVGVWAEGTSYLVEFSEPFPAVATVSAQDMAQA